MNREEYKEYKIKTEEKIKLLNKEITSLETDIKVEFLNYAKSVGFSPGKQASYNDQKWVIEKVIYWNFYDHEDIIQVHLVEPDIKGRITNRCKREYALSQDITLITE